jgi:hypothetical protein
MPYSYYDRRHIIAIDAASDERINPITIEIEKQNEKNNTRGR